MPCGAARQSSCPLNSLAPLFFADICRKNTAKTQAAGIEAPSRSPSNRYIVRTPVFKNKPRTNFGSAQMSATAKFGPWPLRAPTARQAPIPAVRSWHPYRIAGYDPLDEESNRRSDARHLPCDRELHNAIIQADGNRSTGWLPSAARDVGIMASPPHSRRVPENILSGYSKRQDPSRRFRSKERNQGKYRKKND